MIKRLPRNILRLIVLIFLQIFVFNNIEFSQYVNIYIYILFIILLPFETSKWVLLVAAFFLGFTIDLFAGTLGVHSTATVFAAYLRPYVLNMFSPRDGYEAATLPRVHYYGIKWFFNYVFIIVFAHHLLLFYIEIFSFTNFFHTLLRVVLSALFSTVFIVLSQFLAYRK
jgi:rod shape-determining protein MreD